MLIPGGDPLGEHTLPSLSLLSPPPVWLNELCGLMFIKHQTEASRGKHPGAIAFPAGWCTIPSGHCCCFSWMVTNAVSGEDLATSVQMGHDGGQRIWRKMMPTFSQTRKNIHLLWGMSTIILGCVAGMEEIAEELCWIKSSAIPRLLCWRGLWFVLWFRNREHEYKDCKNLFMFIYITTYHRR